MKKLSIILSFCFMGCGSINYPSLLQSPFLNNAGQNQTPNQTPSKVAPKSVQVKELCYDHNYNGDKTGKKCFSTKADYCGSLCQETNVLSVSACSSECR